MDQLADRSLRGARCSNPEVVAAFGFKGPEHSGHVTGRILTAVRYGRGVLRPTDRFQHGSLTDVPGVRIGHYQRIGRGWLTGTTAVIVPNGAVAAVDVRGGGPGTRETDALDPRNLVDRIHGICLTGGSAYGLAAADGVMRFLEQRHLGVKVGAEDEHVVPVVPAAVIFDLGRGGNFSNRPGPDFGERAARSARTSAARGAVGAGTGSQASQLQGGIGLASAIIDVDGESITVGAIAVVNASGSLFDPKTGAPWTVVPQLRRPTADERRALAFVESNAHKPPLNTTIGVVATSAHLTRPETGRLAQSAHDGLARAIRPAHSLMDGDTIFGLSVGDCAITNDEEGIVRGTATRAVALNRIYAAAADVFATACIDAVITTEAVGTAPTYRSICTSAFRDLEAPNR
jgi:L-aminopeptidase/D-esterase-like protein